MKLKQVIEQLINEGISFEFVPASKYGSARIYVSFLYGSSNHDLLISLGFAQKIGFDNYKIEFTEESPTKYENGKTMILVNGSWVEASERN